jgi:hypothetical protein
MSNKPKHFKDLKAWMIPNCTCHAKNVKIKFYLHESALPNVRKRP